MASPSSFLQTKVYERPVEMTVAAQEINTLPFLKRALETSFSIAHRPTSFDITDASAHA
jgi:hypothetical protein